MSRYIDADAVKEALKQNTPQYMWGEVLTTVNIQPYIDLVRCRECKYCEDYESMEGMEYVCDRTWCSPYDWAARPCFYVSSDGFCSYGERKESE